MPHAVAPFGTPAGRQQRRVLGELDPNDLNAPRGYSKRHPITLGQENSWAVFAGISRGTYSFDEVMAWTDTRAMLPTARIHQPEGFDDEGLAGHYPEEDFADQGNLEGEMMEDFDDDELLGEPVDELMDDDLDPEELGGDHDAHGEQAGVDEEIMDTSFDPAALGLKEINNLAHFGVSSHKPGNGVEELLSDDLNKYWQSDGQQPHLLTIHFLRRVEIRAIRFYVDYVQDESYTPTHIVFYAGTGHHDLIQFAEVPLANPVGWQDVPVANCGGGPDGHSLCCWIVQMHIKENHQNGKDTHIRGIKIYALDDAASGAAAREAAQDFAFEAPRTTARHTLRDLEVDEDETFRELLDSINQHEAAAGPGHEGGGFSNFPDTLGEPEIR